MKIVKEGKLPDPIPDVFTCECANCGCVAELSREEFEKLERLPEIQGVRYIPLSGFPKCPTEGCGKRMEFTNTPYGKV